MRSIREWTNGRDWQHAGSASHGDVPRCSSRKDAMLRPFNRPAGLRNVGHSGVGTVPVKRMAAISETIAARCGPEEWVFDVQMLRAGTGECRFHRSRSQLIHGRGSQHINRPDSSAWFEEILNRCGIGDADLFCGNKQFHAVGSKPQTASFDGQNVAGRTVQIRFVPRSDFSKSPAVIFGTKDRQFQTTSAGSDTGSRIPGIAITSDNVQLPVARLSHIAASEPETGLRLLRCNNDSGGFLIDQAVAKGEQTLANVRRQRHGNS